MADPLQIAPEKLYDVLSPIVKANCQRLMVNFSKALGVDISSSGWNFIIDNRQAVDFYKPFTLSNDWESFDAFFKGEKDLFMYMEQPVMGIVSKPAKFWVFFDPKIAVAYFSRQTERPKDFGPAVIKKYPRPAMTGPIIRQVQDILADKSERLNNMIKKVEIYYAVADMYLPEAEAKDFQGSMKQSLLAIALAESQSLQRDITDSGVTPANLEKRLNGMFKLCMRFYGRGNDREKDGLKVLLSPKIEHRKKALELVERRLASDLGH
ncbi:MAG: hypothetical protein A2527_09095 [Candidatus Lambdaproteobacteria bacterium RIFOXYD2_FULL_50_16]|uniref:Uncharacterized protein n=1 Tax=Candidatus Lambdaproteobacteria bacterium RIFOXYD2_FULL_50_16 TaxID=1817772 RepID=A0A1F6G7C1_9PROT|nr:MAG: hypothetical protein A2527_09095 [Candidatus Lambdaproteobacteria bacterium RIFOXYD2_FULL_50_16]